jgi:hypothetical protein
VTAITKWSIDEAADCGGEPHSRRQWQPWDLQACYLPELLNMAWEALA